LRLAAIEINRREQVFVRDISFAAPGHNREDSGQCEHSMHRFFPHFWAASARDIPPPSKKVTY
jgi:hypothetical protein